MEQKLYIIARKDLPDNNPGKMMAQAAHAQADFDEWVRTISRQPDQYKDLITEVEKWKEDRNFGVTLVLHETLEKIDDIMGAVTFGGKTIDPTYPWRNYYGDVFTYNTCTAAWVFICEGSLNSEIELMNSLDLHR